MVNLHFGITGEFITNTARNWFYKEKRELEKSRELILSCCATPDISEEIKNELVSDILEGRKKFIGVNDLELVEDNSFVGSIEEELNQRKRKQQKSNLYADILERPFFYIDSFANQDGWISLAKTKNPYELTINELVKKLSSGRDYDKEYLCDGLGIILKADMYMDFLMEYFPDGITLEASLNRKLEWALTLYFNDMLSKWKEEGKTYSSMLYYEKDVYERQINACEFFDLDFPYGETVKSEDAEKIIREEKNLMDEDKPAIDKDRDCYYFNPDNELHQKSWEYYYISNFDVNCIGLPEKIFKSKYALIAPNGDYFSTSFGGHSTKALNVIASNRILRQDYVDYLIEHGELKEEDREKALGDIRYYGFVISGTHTALDFLMERKWCKVSNSHGGEPIPVVYDDIRGMTKDQEKSFFLSRKYFEKSLKNA